MLEAAIDDGVKGSTFFEMARKWNQDHVQIPQGLPETHCKIFPKYSRHLTIAYKLWRTQTSKTNRIKEARESDILVALKMNPGIRVPGLRQPELRDLDTTPGPKKKRARRQANGEQPSAAAQMGAHRPIPQLLVVPAQPPIPPQLIVAPSRQHHSTTRFHTILPPSPYHIPAHSLPYKPLPHQRRQMQLCAECKCKHSRQRQPCTGCPPCEDGGKGSGQTRQP